MSAYGATNMTMEDDSEYVSKIYFCTDCCCNLNTECRTQSRCLHDTRMILSLCCLSPASRCCWFDFQDSHTQQETRYQFLFCCNMWFVARTKLRERAFLACAIEKLNRCTCCAISCAEADMNPNKDIPTTFQPFHSPCNLWDKWGYYYPDLERISADMDNLSIKLNEYYKTKAIKQKKRELSQNVYVSRVDLNCCNNVHQFYKSKHGTTSVCANTCGLCCLSTMTCCDCCGVRTNVYFRNRNVVYDSIPVDDVVNIVHVYQRENQETFQNKRRIFCCCHCNTCMTCQFENEDTCYGCFIRWTSILTCGCIQWYEQSPTGMTNATCQSVDPLLVQW